MERIVTAALALALLAGCASATRDPGGYGRAVLVDPIERGLGANAVRAAPGTVLSAAHVDGRPALCTEGAAYFALAEARRVCFFDDHGLGKVDEGWVVGTLAATSFAVTPPARYRLVSW